MLYQLVTIIAVDNNWVAINQKEIIILDMSHQFLLCGFLRSSLM